MSKTDERAIINFHELSPKWQAEARRNLDEMAEETAYLEPKEDTDPETHVLWDLSDAMRQTGTHEGFEYDAVIGISNNSAMLLKLGAAGESAKVVVA